jgi:hypothetical protein
MTDGAGALCEAETLNNTGELGPLRLGLCGVIQAQNEEPGPRPLNSR